MAALNTGDNVQQYKRQAQAATSRRRQEVEAIQQQGKTTMNVKHGDGAVNNDTNAVCSSIDKKATSLLAM